MNYKTTPIEFDISNRQGQTAKLKLIRKDVKREVIFNDTMKLSFSTENHPENAIGYDLIENENMIIHDGHVYKIKQITDYGNYKKLNCIHEFSDLSKFQIYDYLEGNQTAGNIIRFLFQNTSWTYELADVGIDNYYVFLRPEKFGAGSVIRLLNEFLKRTGLEFEILPGKKISFSFSIGGSERAYYNYGENIKSLSADTDSTNYYTRIRGFYTSIIGKDEDGNDITEWDYTEVINEEAELKYGILEMDSVWDSNITNSSNMYFLLWTKLYTDFQESIDLDSVDFEVKKIGQRVVINHPQINISQKGLDLRILKITEGLIHNELKPTNVEIGNYFWEYFETQAEDRIDTLEKEIRKLKNNTNNIALSKLMIGNKNLFSVQGLILASNATLPDDITGVVEYSKMNEFTGLFLTKKKSYEGFYTQVKTYNKNNVLTGTYDYDSQKIDLESWKLPSDNIFAVTIEVMSKNPNDFVEGTDKKQIFAFRFNEKEINPEPGGGIPSIYFNELRTGDYSWLNLNSIEETGSAISYIKGELRHVIPSFIKYTPTTLTGLFANLTEAYSAYYLTVINTSDIDGTIDTFHGSYSSDLNNFDIPFSGTNYDAFTVVITDVPFDNLMQDNSLITDSFIKAFGIKFILKEEEEGGDGSGGTEKLIRFVDYDGASISSGQEQNLNFQIINAPNSYGYDKYFIEAEDTAEVVAGLAMQVEGDNAIISISVIVDDKDVLSGYKQSINGFNTIGIPFTFDFKSSSSPGYRTPRINGSLRYVQVKVNSIVGEFEILTEPQMYFKSSGIDFVVTAG